MTGSVTAVTSKLEFTDSGRAEANGYFNNGLLTWTSGANAGLQMEVKDFTSNTFTLFESMINDISVSPQDTYSVVAGCDKTADTCKTKFNNMTSHGGFRYLPGQMQISSVANQRKNGL